MHLAVDVGLTDASGDKLGDLRPKVQDQNLVVLHGLSRLGSWGLLW